MQLFRVLFLACWLLMLATGGEATLSKRDKKEKKKKDKVWPDTVCYSHVCTHSICYTYMYGTCMQGRRYRGGQGGLGPPHFQRQGG